MAITREYLLEFLASNDKQKTYKSTNSGAGLSNILHFGYVYVYSKLGATSKKRIDNLAKTLVDEINSLDEKTTPKEYYENTYYLFKNRLGTEYILEQVKLMKSDNKKLASIVVGLQKVLGSDMLQRIQDYKEIK